MDASGAALEPRAEGASTASAEHFDIGSDRERESNASGFLGRVGFTRGQSGASIPLEHYLISSDAEHNDGSVSSRSIAKSDRTFFSMTDLPDPEQAAEMHRSTSLAHMASKIVRLPLELFVGFPCGILAPSSQPLPEEFCFCVSLRSNAERIMAELHAAEVRASPDASPDAGKASAQVGACE